MPNNRRIFLTTDQALTAVQNDLERYPAQLTLMETLLPLAFGPHAYLIRKAGDTAVWIKTGAGQRPQSVGVDQLGAVIVERLRRKRLTPEQLAAVCTRVFQAAVTIDARGFWVDTGMNDFTCQRCGRCCRTLDYRDGCSVADYRRWQALGREDILRWVGVVRREGRIVACRIWMEPGTNRYAGVCPWLRQTADGRRHSCTIHVVRPTICREYPGTRKHARMTGCRGV